MNPIRILLASALLLAAGCATATRSTQPASSNDVSLSLDLQDGKYLYVEGEIDGTWKSTLPPEPVSTMYQALGRSSSCASIAT